MGVRIKIEIGFANSFIKTNALVNTAYEVEDCELLIPVKLARKLNVWPKLPKDTEAIPYLTPMGRVTFLKVGKGKVKVVVHNKKTEFVETDIVISEDQREVFISDALASELKIQLISPGKGIWRFSDDPPETMRGSEKGQYWE